VSWLSVRKASGELTLGWPVDQAVMLVGTGNEACLVWKPRLTLHPYEWSGRGAAMNWWALSSSLLGGEARGSMSVEWPSSAVGCESCPGQDPPPRCSVVLVAMRHLVPTQGELRQISAMRCRPWRQSWAARDQELVFLASFSLARWSLHNDILVGWTPPIYDSKFF
jgi:hypothetical protein